MYIVPHRHRNWVLGAVRIVSDTESAFIMIVSSEPSITSRWVPLPNTEPLPGEPKVTVDVSPPGDLVGRLCYSYILHVK
jgi:hypothetical protein